MLSIKEESLKMDFIADNEEMYKDLEDNTIVKAEYKKDIEGICKPTLCCLQRPLSAKELLKFNSVPLPYDRKNIVSLPKSIRMNLAFMIKDDLRFFIPYHQKLSDTYYRCLRSSYKNRRLEYISEKKPAILSVSPEISTSVMCMSLVGTSGSGKSTAVQMMLKRQPHVVSHVFSSKISFIQIMYVSLTATPSTNGHAINALFVDIAKQIDRTLGLTDTFKAEMIKRRTTAAMEDYLISLIERFHIGCIIVDEVQLCASGKLFEHLLTIMSKTQVTMLLIGTEEATKLLNSTEWSARRFTHLGRVESDIGSDASTINAILNQLWMYQFTVNEYPKSDDVFKLLLEESHGNVDYLTTLFVMAQIMVIQDEGNGNKGLTKKTFEEAIKKFPLTNNLICSGAREIELAYKLDKKAVFDALHDAVTNQQKLEAESSMKYAGHMMKNLSHQISDAISRISSMHDYSSGMIKDSFMRLYRTNEDFINLSPKDKSRMILADIQRRHKDSSISNPIPTTRNSTNRKKMKESSIMKELEASCTPIDEIIA